MLLHENTKKKEIQALEKIESTISTLNQLVTFLTDERTKGDQTIKHILLENHPLFDQIKSTLDIKYCVFFHNIEEMEALFEARKTEPRPVLEWQDPDYREYINNWKKQNKIIQIWTGLFDEGNKLKAITPNEWTIPKARANTSHRRRPVRAAPRSCDRIRIGAAGAPRPRRP